MALEVPTPLLLSTVGAGEQMLVPVVSLLPPPSSWGREIHALVVVPKPLQELIHCLAADSVLALLEASPLQELIHCLAPDSVFALLQASPVFALLEEPLARASFRRGG
jgi:hypothetical protein